MEKSSVKSTEEEANNMTCEKENLTQIITDFSNLSDEYKRAKEENIMLLTEIESIKCMKQICEPKKNSSELLRETVIMLEKKSNSLKNENVILSSTITELKEKIDNNFVDGTYKEMKEKQDNLVMQIHNLSTENEELVKTIEEMNIRNRDVEEGVRQPTNQESTKMELLLNQANNDLDTTFYELEIQKIRNKQMTDQVDEMKRSIELHKSEYDKIRDENKSINSNITYLNERIKDLTEKLGKQKDSVGYQVKSSQTPNTCEDRCCPRKCRRSCERPLKHRLHKYKEYKANILNEVFLVLESLIDSVSIPPHLANVGMLNTEDVIAYLESEQLSRNQVLGHAVGIMKRLRNSS